VLYRLHHANLTSHQPESQYKGLILIIDRLRSLPQFQKKPGLLRLAEYRIAVARGRTNLRAGAYDLAVPKLQRACRLKRVPLIAASLLVWAQIGSGLRRQRNQKR
jgi:hypothetical protein